ncbi:MAG: NAD(P)/FAD-dependent oxidoreductase [bacterium]
MSKNLHTHIEQRSVESLIESTWDCVVVGAGPAGAMTALHLARRGGQVLLLDGARFPRDKVCGDGLTPTAAASLQRAGLLPLVQEAGHAVAGAAVWTSSSDEYVIQRPFITLRRRLLDSLVTGAAVAAGAEFYQGRVVDLEIAGDGVVITVAGRATPLHARVTVLATGVELNLCRRLGLGGPGPSGLGRPSAIAVRRYVRSAVPIERLTAFYDPTCFPGYGWIFPLGDNNHNIGVELFPRVWPASGQQAKQAFDRFSRRFRLARDLLAAATEIGPLQGGALRWGLKSAPPLGVANVLCVGDTIGAAVPFTGEGISRAMETGELAAQIIHKALDRGKLERLRDYPQIIEQELRPLQAEKRDRWKPLCRSV